MGRIIEKQPNSFASVRGLFLKRLHKLICLLLLSTNSIANTDFTYSFVNGVEVEVTGFSCVNGCPTELVIPETIDGYSVKSIADYAFRKKMLTSLILPDSVEAIGVYAFEGNGLKTLAIPYGVTSIGSRAFSDNQLTNLTIPASMLSIGNASFAVNNITNIYFLGDRPGIHRDAFNWNYGVQTVSYCPEANGWPGEVIRDYLDLIVPQMDAACDSDNDGIINLSDAFPFDSSEALDTDLDGIGDNADTDGGATDGVEASGIIDMTGTFGGAALQGSTYTFPAGSEVWAGFANLNTDVYPFTFSNEGTITFSASAAEDTNIYFRFERLPHPDVEPSFNLDPVLISGAEEREYTVTVPAQDAANTYESFSLYVVELDSPVIIKDIVVTHDGGFTGVPEEAAYVEPSSAGIEIIKDAMVTADWGGNASLSFKACGPCAKMTLATVTDNQRGDVLQVSYSDDAGHAVLEIQTSGIGVDISAFSELSFDIKIINIGLGVGFNYLAKSSSSTQMPVDISVTDSDFWQTITVPVSALSAVDLTDVIAPFVFFPDVGKGAGLVYQLDNVRWQSGDSPVDSDGGSTDGGSTDGSANGGSIDTVGVEMIEGYGGALFDADTSTYTFPAGSEVWAGFANLNVDIYPFTFANGGTITFTAAVPAGGADTSIYFRFERLPFPDVDPSFNLDPVLIVSEAELQYSVTIPAQDAANTYESLLMYVVEQDQPVIVKNIVVTDDNGSTANSTTGGGTTDGGSTDGGSTDGGSTGGGSTDGGSTDGGSTDGGSTDGSANGGSIDTVGVEMIEGYGGALFDADTSTYTFPVGSEVWAGFANLNVDIYPFTFANGGTITFTAAVPAGGADTSIYFRFERLPFPDVDPSFNLDPVLIVSEAELQYSVTIPAQDAANTYESLLMYVVEQDQPVIVKNIVVTDDNGGIGGGNSDCLSAGNSNAESNNQWNYYIEATGVKITGCSGICPTELVLPNLIECTSVISIGSSAFFGNQLMSVTIPDSVTSIGDSAFSGNQLTSVTIPNSVTSIGRYAFQNNRLATVILPNSITQIELYTFASNKLTHITIPDSVISINNGAFKNNRLTSVSLGNSVASIAFRAFQFNRLARVTLPDSVDSVGTEAFDENPLKQLIVDNSFPSVSDYAFSSPSLEIILMPNGGNFESIVNDSNSGFGSFGYPPIITYCSAMDTDGDTIMNCIDDDDDGDGIIDARDVFPLVFTESIDSDGDGIGNNADIDDDNDGLIDQFDDLPLNSSEWQDYDNDGIGNNADIDDDNDGVVDSLDIFPLNANSNGLVSSLDYDGDGIADSLDLYPTDPTNQSLNWIDVDGSGKVDALTDTLLITRYVFGFTGDDLIKGAIGEEATRATSAEIEAYLEALIPEL
jgi:hypothetical protein